MATKFRIACCRCRKPIPLSQDIYHLDAEWQRRYPAMHGTLACHKCSVGTEWRCTVRGSFVDGHIPAVQSPGVPDFDSWSHISAEGTHAAMVVGFPHSGLLQGAEDYLRSLVQRKGVNPEVAESMRSALRDWDGSPARRHAAVHA